jgi:hypothetical protein
MGRPAECLTCAITNFDPGEPGGSASGVPDHANEPHSASLASRLNWLRAGVLGANDGALAMIVTFGIGQLLGTAVA